MRKTLPSGARQRQRSTYTSYNASPRYTRNPHPTLLLLPGPGARQPHPALQGRKPRRRRLHSRRAPPGNHREEDLRPEGASQSPQDRRKTDHIRVGYGADAQEVRVPGCTRALAQTPKVEHTLVGAGLHQQHF